jgi:MFS family permease
LFIGVGSSATFAPLLADTSHWFSRRRGIAVAIIASGNYLAGTIWPPIVQHFIESSGWRHTFLGIAILCVATMLPLVLTLRRRAPNGHDDAAMTAHRTAVLNRPLGFSPQGLQGVLIVAGICCCVAMSMPQVHLVAYCGDLGYGAARGAQMLSVLLGCGIISRLAFGWISDRIGGLRTLLIGSSMQCFAFVSVSAIRWSRFAFRNLGVVRPVSGRHCSVLRHHHPRIFLSKGSGRTHRHNHYRDAGGMAFGGWTSGVIFDLTGSYRAAFLNGIAWNVVNMAIALMLLGRSRGQRAAAFNA